jgi:hypothetical protein
MRLHGRPGLTKKVVPIERLTESSRCSTPSEQSGEKRIMSEEGERRERQRRKNELVVLLVESVLGESVVGEREENGWIGEMGEDILGENRWTGESSARGLACSKISEPARTTQHRASFGASGPK